MNPSLSTFSKQDSDRLLKNLFCPRVPHKETGNFRGKERGPSFLHGGPGRLGSRRVLAGGQLGPKAEEGPLPSFCSQRSSPGSRKVVAPCKKFEEKAGVAVLEGCPRGSCTLSLTEQGKPVLTVSSSSSTTTQNLNETSPLRPTEFLLK